MKNNRIFAVMFGVVISLILLLTAFVLQIDIQNHTRDINRNNLNTVLDVTEQGLRNWLDGQKKEVTVWANTPEIRAYTKALLAIRKQHADAPVSDSLLAEYHHESEALESPLHLALETSPTQVSLRLWFQPILQVKDYQGFFIIGRDGVSLASARHANLGTKNLLTEQAQFLDRIWRGKASVSLPQISDVSLPDKEEHGELREGLPTMFSAAPIYSDSGEIVAALAFRIDPRGEFAQIFNQARWGMTGESLAFAANGLLLSDVRFEEELYRKGLLQPGAWAMLNLKLHNKLFSHVHAEHAFMQPDHIMGTHVAENLDGYTNYAGKKVIGLYRWVDEYDMGMAVEIEAPEAYAMLKLTNGIFWAFAGVSVLLAWVLIFSFVQGRRRIEEGRLRLKGIIDMADDAIISIDESQQIILFNPAAEKIFGYQEKEMLGKSLEGLIPERFRDGHGAKVNTFRESEQQDLHYTKRGELFGLRKNGEEFPMEAMVSRQLVEGSSILTVAIRDVSRIRAANEEKDKLQLQLLQAQKIESIGHLTGGIAHDFNNMLAAIRGYTELSIEQLAGSQHPLLDNLSRIRETCLRAASLVEKLLAFSRGSNIEMRSQALQPVVEKSLEMLTAVMPSSVEIKTNFQARLPDVKFDAVQLDQIIVNLCINARDALGGFGSIVVGMKQAKDCSLVCSSCHQDVVGDFVEISVSDTGEGIPPEIMNNLFEPFFTTKEVGKGSGMGLAVVHGVVHGHGGHIHVDSVPGNGTRFALYFPVSNLPQQQVLRDASDAAAKPEKLIVDPKSRAKHLMLVDDEVEVAFMISDILSYVGYEVTIFTDSQTALSAFERDPNIYDLVITDQVMPNVTGLMLAKLMWTLRPDVPVILCSGYSAEVDEAKAMAFGFTAYLNKPFDARYLVQCVDEVFAIKAQPSA